MLQKIYIPDCIYLDGVRHAEAFGHLRRVFDIVAVVPRWLSRCYGQRVVIMVIVLIGVRCCCKVQVCGRVRYNRHHRSCPKINLRKTHELRS